MSVRFGKAVPLPSPGSDPVQHPPPAPLLLAFLTGVRQPFAMGTTFCAPPGVLGCRGNGHHPITSVPGTARSGALISAEGTSQIPG